MKHKREEIAVALGGEAGTPTVLAVGRENLARDIVKMARRYGVPVDHDPLLATALSQAEEALPAPPAGSEQELLAKRIK